MWMRYARNVGIIVTALIGLVTIAGWLRSCVATPKYKLVARIHYGKWESPKSINKLFSEQANRWKAVDTMFAWTDMLLTRYDLDLLLLQYNGYWNIQLSNEGSETLEDVVVNLPNVTYASVNRSGSRVDSAYSASIPVGVLRPKDVVRIMAWSSIDVSDWAASKAYITHRNGTGKVVIYYPMHQFWHKFRDFISAAIFVLLISIVISLMRVINISPSKSTSKQDSS